MLKKYVSVTTILGLILSSSLANVANAIDLDEDTRTVPLDSKGSTVILTPEQVKRGKRLFNTSCAQCHGGGITKTNPNVGLEPESLSYANPPRDNVQGLISFIKNPTSYDGTESIAEIHPGIESADIFPKMRALTDEDLFVISGHILLQPKVVAEKWGGGKIYF